MLQPSGLDVASMVRLFDNDGDMGRPRSGGAPSFERVGDSRRTGELGTRGDGRQSWGSVAIGVDVGAADSCAAQRGHRGRRDVLGRARGPLRAAAGASGYSSGNAGVFVVHGLPRLL
jgi:hypothetical protein